MTRTNYVKKMQDLGKRFSELSGREVAFCGCNGEYFCRYDVAPSSFLLSYHAPKDICLYLEGLIDGFTIKK